ncbi:FGGY family carbohydrate kinase [Ulvibacterium sp.]|uniref:FGGY-family carbohydrate kinase n=1 Tax=Ulvibacterium sp. TaxID=2665914 RepID=UPI0026092D97|nr:FGGY family carbohydrate kinase [Ulvibacterium sp.]
MKKVTAIFDIGKTNKKFFLIDKDYQEVYREYIQIKEVFDEDDYPADDLEALQKWMLKVLPNTGKTRKFEVTAINFSSYGASLVHLDKYGNVIGPLYNYTKPLDDGIINDFYKKHGPKTDFLIKTGSPALGMLNSGLQLYWLKYRRPEKFKRIRHSLHLPQYLSYVFTKKLASERTSIGCHTALWDYSKRDYHHWVYQEDIHRILPPILPTDTKTMINFNGYSIPVGIGIHDSSAALLPYLRSIDHHFVLLSTGTWSIALNPFSDCELNEEEVEVGSTLFMGTGGAPIKSMRLFLGNEYRYQKGELCKKYSVPLNQDKSVVFDPMIYKTILQEYSPCFKWIGIEDENSPSQTNYRHLSFETAYHQLITELAKLQATQVISVIGKSKIRNVYVDGGFARNDVFMKILAHQLNGINLYTAENSIGSTLGAVIGLKGHKLDQNFLESNYRLKKIVPDSVEL